MVALQIHSGAEWLLRSSCRSLSLILRQSMRSVKRAFSRFLMATMLGGISMVQGLASAAPRKPTSTSGSRVLELADRRLRGRSECQIRFAYSDRSPEDLIWAEPCKALTARMVSRDDLRSMGKWERLDPAVRNAVLAMRGGEVLCVEGRFSASIYPVGTSGSSYEVGLSD